MKIIKYLTNVKIISTIGSLFLFGLHECLVPFCSFSIPYVFAVMYDDTIVARFGLFIIIFFGIYLLTWIVSPILLRIGNRFASSVGIAGIIALNLCDMLCCIVSFVGQQKIFKLINFVFSSLIVIISCLLLQKKWSQKAEDRGRFSVLR